MEGSTEDDCLHRQIQDASQLQAKSYYKKYNVSFITTEVRIQKSKYVSRSVVGNV